MHLVSIVKLESTISPEFFRAYCDLMNETKRTENMNISVLFFADLHYILEEIKSSTVCKGRTAPFSHKMQIYNFQIRFREATAVQLQAVKHRCS